MKRRCCPHHTQYAEPGRPLPCADPRCPGSPTGDAYFVPRWTALWVVERAYFRRVIDDGVIVWRQETPWARWPS